MKMINVLFENVDKIKGLLKKTLIFSLPGGPENVAVQLVPSLMNIMERGMNKKIYLDAYVELFLDEETKVRKDVFQEIAEGVIQILKNRGYPDLDYQFSLLRFKEVNIYKNKSKIDFFVYVDPVLRDEIKRPVYMKNIDNRSDHFHFVHEDVLPTIDVDYDKEEQQRQNRAKNVFRAFRRGRVEGIRYEMDDDIKVSVIPDHTKFDVDNNVIRPHFNITITCPLPQIEDESQIASVMTALHRKFESLNIKIKFRGE